MDVKKVGNANGGKRMVHCAACEQVPAQSDGCELDTFVYNGKPYPRICVGSVEDLLNKDNIPDNRCPSCRALVGRCHHHLCEYERCPVCKGVFARCACEGSLDCEPLT